MLGNHLKGAASPRCCHRVERVPHTASSALFGSVGRQQKLKVPICHLVPRLSLGFVPPSIVSGDGAFGFTRESKPCCNLLSLFLATVSTHRRVLLKKKEILFIVSHIPWRYSAEMKDIANCSLPKEMDPTFNIYISGYWEKDLEWYIATVAAFRSQH